LTEKKSKKPAEKNDKSNTVTPDLVDVVLPDLENSTVQNTELESSNLESLLSEIEQQKEEEEALENAPSSEEILEASERATKIAKGANGLVMKGLSMLYPAAKIEDEKINAGVESLKPLAEKYGNYIPEWLVDSPEMAAGMYIGGMFYAAKKSHTSELIRYQQEAIALQEQIAAQNEAILKQGGQVGT